MQTTTHTTTGNVIDARTIETKRGKRTVLTLATEQFGTGDAFTGPDEVQAILANGGEARVRVVVKENAEATVDGVTIGATREVQFHVLPADPMQALAQAFADHA